MIRKASVIFVLVLLAAAAMSAIVLGQGGFAPAAGGSGLDISGSWRYGGHQDGAYGTAAGALVDYGGFPLNEAGRLWALAWAPARMTVRQQQCAGYGNPYIYFSPGNYRFWEERDPYTQKLIAIKMWFQTSEVRRTIWMDGRPHPPAYAPHTFPGFSTGEWTGNVLTITTTHLKRAWLRGNGVPISDQATVTERLIRYGDRLTIFVTVNDPVFMDAPYTKSMINLRNTKLPDAWLYACDDAEQVLARREDQTPHYLWGSHPFLRDFIDKNEMPLLGALGGAQTMQASFAGKLRDSAAADAEAMTKIVPSQGPQQSSRAVNPDPNDGEIHVWPVQGNVYMLVGDGGNIAVQIGDQGAFVVDSGTGKLADRVVAAIQKLTPRPIQFVANTSFRPEHTGGNSRLGDAGEDPSLPGSFFAGQSPRAVTGFFQEVGSRATLLAHVNVQVRMQDANLPTEMIPADTYLQGRRRKHHNGELVEMFYMPNAVTDGDSIVQFRRSDVIATGAIFDTTRYPFIDIKNGGTIDGELAALNTILEKTGYEHQGDGGTMIIPGRGRVADEYDLSEYRDMLTIIRDRVRALIGRGASVEQVKAARVTADYDTRFGATSGAWTTDMFVEAVYTSLHER
jgi:glyoxylase-like metal-dependent hydrolase (beta-lactamase superfamily II)